MLSALALLLLHLGPDARLLEARQVFHEYPSFQMIHFVLDANREQPLGFDFEALAVQSKSTHGDAFGALDSLVDAGHRQASFFAIGHPGGDEYLRIYQNQQFVAAIGCVDDDYLFVHVYLRRGKTYAGRGVHGLGHVCDQGADALIYFCHGNRDFMQAGVRIAQDVKAGHKDLLIERIRC